MSIEMQIFYHTINAIVTAFYYFYQMVLLQNIVDHKKHIAKTIFIYSTVYLITDVMTETLVPVFIKSLVQMILFTILYGLLLTEKVAVVAVYLICQDLSMALQENTIIFVCKLNHIVPWVDVGHGVQLGKARVILMSCFLQLVLTLLLKRFLKPTSEMMGEKDTWRLVFVLIFLSALLDMFEKVLYRHVNGRDLFYGIISHIVLVVVGVVLYIYSLKKSYLERKQREERFKMEALEKQFTYYQEKQKDEERVRAIYHDMKNHLLVLEHQIHSPETAEMVEKLQQEMESYADYVHTGNDFLDVILKDKAGIAREKQIDFSVSVDFQGIDFMEPLDISTIFGNGLDNAIEASEKLPEGQRVVLVKAGRVQNFLSIVMENNCQEERIPASKAADQKEGTLDRKKDSQKEGILGRREGVPDRKHTSKKDKQLHGFGISNMKHAAEKYDGQLTVKCEKGKFLLNILIPIPTMKQNAFME